MRRLAMALVTAGLLAFGVAACGGTGDSGSSSNGAPAAKGEKLAPADITLWVGFTARELGVIKHAVAGFEKENPQVKVKVVGGINDDKIIAASRGGKSPDVAQSFSADNAGAFCGSGAWLDLKPYHGPRRDQRQHLPARPALVHAVRRHPLLAADARRRLRPLLQRGPAQEGGPERTAEDGLRARRLREEADRQEPRRIAEGRRVQPEYGLVLEHAGQLRPDVRRQVGRRQRQVDARQRPRVGEAPQLAEAADRLVRIQQSRQVPGRSRG